MTSFNSYKARQLVHCLGPAILNSYDFTYSAKGKAFLFDDDTLPVLNYRLKKLNKSG